MNKVQNAIDLMHTRYNKGIEKVLAAEESHEGATITFNTREIELLKLLVFDRIGAEHQTWYDITHDEDLEISDMAYELAGSKQREDRLQRLYNKLSK